jgi:hypothetical protein
MLFRVEVKVGGEGGSGGRKALGSVSRSSSEFNLVTQESTIVSSHAFLALRSASKFSLKQILISS